MRVEVKYKYPDQPSVTIEVPNRCIIHGHWQSLEFDFVGSSVGIKSLDVLRSNIKYYLKTNGYITDKAEIRSVQIFDEGEG